eukprot:747870-Hanusia_phi.AAC.6
MYQKQISKGVGVNPMEGEVVLLCGASRRVVLIPPVPEQLGEWGWVGSLNFGYPWSTTSLK